MDNNYFDFLSQNVSSDKTEKENGTNLVNLTVRADAECIVNCDGDFLFLLEPGKIQKEKVPVGQHILEFVSTDNPEVKIEKVVEYSELGKNYVLLISDLKDEITKIAEEEIQRKKREETEAIHTITIVCNEHSGVYTGNLVDGKPNGKGCFKCDEGSWSYTYEGEWKDGKRHGKGVETSYQSGCVISTFEGEFKDDQDIRGVITWADGDKYEGEVKNGWMDGYGIMTYANGDTYEGEWLNDQPCGKGKEIFVDGSFFDGIFENGIKKKGLFK